MPEWVLQVVGLLVTGGAIYGGIRADIKGLHAGLSEAKDAARRAHERIDGILIKG